MRTYHKPSHRTFKSIIMEKKILSFLFLLTYCSFLTAQSYFNKNFTFAQINGINQNIFQNICVSHDTIVAYGSIRLPSTSYKQGVLLTMFDSSGNLLKQKNIMFPDSNSIALDDGYGIIKTSDGGYALVAASYPKLNTVFIKVNYDLEVEIIKEFEDDTVRRQLGYSKIIGLPNGYVFFGTTVYYEGINFGEGDGAAMRVDLQGNVLWRKSYGYAGANERFESGFSFNDSTFVFAGSYRWSYDWFHQKRIIYVIDGNGNEKKAWTESENSAAVISQILPNPTRDGYITFNDVFKGLFTGVANGNDKIAHTFTELDSNFQTKWTTPVATNLYDGEKFLAFYQTKSGNYIGAGGRSKFTAEVGNSDSNGWFFSISPTGDSLWANIIKGGTSFAYSNHVFNGIGELSSGNIILSGAISEFGANPLNSYAGEKCWLVKIGKDGCADELCSVNADKILTLSPPERLKIYPNPASDELTIELLPNLQSGRLTLRLCNQLGQTVHSQAWREESPTQTISVASLPSGFYVVSVTNGAETWYQKVIIQR